MDDGSSLCTLSAHLWMMGQVYALSVFCTFFLFIVYFICLKKYMFFFNKPLHIYRCFPCIKASMCNCPRKCSSFGRNNALLYAETEVEPQTPYLFTLKNKFSH